MLSWKRLNKSILFPFFAVLLFAVLLHQAHAQVTVTPTTTPTIDVTITDSPTNGVPSGYCLGSCPTVTPTLVPTIATASPTVDPCLSQNPGSSPGSGGFGGFLQLIFELIQLLFGGFGSGTTPCLGQTPVPTSSIVGPVSTVAPVTTTPTASGSSQFSCSGAGIAAFADQLANTARTNCTADGTGVVTDTNYSCLQNSVTQLAPPYSSVANDRIAYWSQNGNDFAGKTQKYQCVEFAFAVTGAVCGQIMNNGTASDIGTNQNISGYTFTAKGQGSMQAGDIIAYLGHVAIVAEVIDSNHMRIAEANNLNPDGSQPDYSTNPPPPDTGVVSNTRIDTMDDPDIIGWYRKQ